MKLSFVRLAEGGAVAFAALGGRFGVSRSCGYKWLARFREAGEAGLEERSRRPQLSPGRSPAVTEAAVVALRRANPAWGGRKIAACLAREGGPAVAPSTVTGIVRRAGLPIGAEAARAAWRRFEADAPNALWQMDFKGHVALGAGRLHPLTVLDDHSRYAIVLAACGDEREETVKARLVEAFRRHGLPHRMVCDNGPPWGTSGQGRPSAPTVWLTEQDIAVSHSRPLHPQTMGKDERFHRSLKAEALSGPRLPDLGTARRHLDRWRNLYNHRRPHDAPGGAVPADRYRPSARARREVPEPFPHGPDDQMRKVSDRGDIGFAGRRFRVSHALTGRTVAVRPTLTDGVHDIFFRHLLVRTIDLRQQQDQTPGVRDVLAHLSTMSPVQTRNGGAAIGE